VAARARRHGFGEDAVRRRCLPGRYGWCTRIASVTALAVGLEIFNGDSVNQMLGLPGRVDHLGEQQDVTPHTAVEPRQAPTRAAAGAERASRPGQRGGRTARPTRRQAVRSPSPVGAQVEACKECRCHCPTAPCPGHGSRRSSTRLSRTGRRWRQGAPRQLDTIDGHHDHRVTPGLQTWWDLAAIAHQQPSMPTPCPYCRAPATPQAQAQHNRDGNPPHVPSGPSHAPS
jgi:hypothetical protein